MTRTLLAILLLYLSSIITEAQTPPVPTPAPSKTPEATTPATPNDIIPPNTELERSFIQSDLSVLTGNVQRPNAIAWIDNKLYISCSGDWTLYQVDPDTGATTTFISGIRDAHQILPEKTEQGFNLWIPDFDTNSLFLVTQRRTTPRVITTSGLNGPWGIAFFDENQFVITNLKSNNIVTVSREGQTQEIATGLRSPAGIVVDSDFIYVSNNGSARRAIEWFRKDEAGTGVTLHSLVTGLQNVSNLILAADGYLYFTYSLGTRGVVGRVMPEVCRDTGCTNEQVEIVVYTELPAPLAGLTLSPDMRLFVHTIYRPEIYQVSLYRNK